MCYLRCSLQMDESQLKAAAYEALVLCAAFELPFAK